MTPFKHFNRGLRLWVRLQFSPGCLVPPAVSWSRALDRKGERSSL